MIISSPTTLQALDQHGGEIIFSWLTAIRIRSGGDVERRLKMGNLALLHTVKRTMSNLVIIGTYRQMPPCLTDVLLYTASGMNGYRLPYIQARTILIPYPVYPRAGNEAKVVYLHTDNATGNGEQAQCRFQKDFSRHARR